MSLSKTIAAVCITALTLVGGTAAAYACGHGRPPKHHPPTTSTTLPPTTTTSAPV